MIPLSKTLGNVERLVSTPGLLFKNKTKSRNGFARAPSRKAALEPASADGSHSPDLRAGGGQPGSRGWAGVWDSVRTEESPSKSQCGAQTHSGSKGSAPWPATTTLRALSADNLTKTSLSPRPILSFTFPIWWSGPLEGVPKTG